jgi:hypothetical protein
MQHSLAPVAGIVCAMLIPIFAFAQQVTFRWEYPASGAAGFVLYCGRPGVRYTAIVDVGNTETYTLRGLAPGEVYECAVTAYDATRSQSAFSVPVRFYLSSTGRCSRACDGDLNGDGSINVFDVGILKQEWRTSGPEADLNGDGIVDVFDLGIFRALYQRQQR